MMKSITRIIGTAVLLTAGITGAAVQTPPADPAAFRNEPLNAEMKQRTGLAITSPIAELSFYSSIMAIEPPWRNRRFFSEEYGVPGKPEQRQSGVRVELLQGNPTNEFKLNEYSCDVNGTTATVTLRCEATADIPSVFEYSAFAVPASLLSCATYTGTLEDGETFSGKIPRDEPDAVAPLKKAVRQISFQTMLGKLSFAVKEGPCFNIVDRRGVSFADKKCFWFGYQTTLDYGKPFNSVIEVSFSIDDDLVLAVPEKTALSAPLESTVVPGGIAAYKPDLKLLPRPKKIVQPLPGTGKFIPLPSEVTVRIAGLDDAAEYDRLGRAAKRILGKMNAETRIVDPRLRMASFLNIRIAPDSMENPEGYTLTVDRSGVSIASPTPRGAFYALQTLRSLAGAQGVPECSIEDWPDMKIRAAHLLVDDYSKIFHTDLVDNVLAPMKYNMVVPECEFVKWDSTKELHQKWGMEKQDYIDFAAWCKDNYIDVVPLFQTFGHCGWMFPEQADGTHLNSDLAEDVNYPYAYNVSNPRLYPFIEKVLDEVMEASGNPAYLHIGHDEVFHPKAKFPCRPENIAKGIKKVLYDDVMWYYNYGKKHNVRIMLWHDLFVTPEESPENGAGGAPNNLAEVRKELPRDLLFVAWRYDGRTLDFPDITALRKDGFDIVGAPWNEKNNVEHLAEFCQKAGGVGMLQTIWCGYNGNRTVAHNGFWQLVPYVRTGIWSWNANPAANVSTDPGEVFCDLINDWYDNAAGDAIAIDISKAANLKLTPENNPFLSRDTYGFEQQPTGIQQIGRVAFNLPERDKSPAAIALQSRLNPLFPESVTLPLELKTPELYLLCTGVDNSPQRFTTLADLKVIYEDGTTSSLPLQYTWQLNGLNDDYNFYQNTGNVRKWTDRDKERRVWFFTWKNPYPDKTIKAVELSADKDRYSFYLLAISAKKQ
ncbi:MAG: beta-N-acetylhexosaminidase [Victivallaceae bacterium]|nr:beta-N-acetylhexosaminidase [Victivallaceae bacterium]